jgi:imidazolonepropionase-like amidohydrolase
LLRRYNLTSMNRLSRACLSLAALFLLPLVLQTASAQIAVKGEMVYTMAGDPIPDGVVLMRDGVIEAVGPASSVSIPGGYRVLEAAVVTPGLIDAHSVVGLAGYLNQDDDQDQLETSSPIQPELRAIDAYNARETLVEWVRGFGVTTIHTGHGPGALVSGQTLVAKTHGESLAEVLVDSTTMLAMTLGPGIGSRFGGTPGTRSKALAMMRTELVKAQDYRRKLDEGEDVSRDLKMEALVSLLRGEVAGLVTVEHAQDIVSAIRLADEFGFRLVLDSASEAPLVIDEIRAAGVPVILHATMVRPGGSRASASFETAAILADAGIPVALQSGFESYVPKTRVVLFEAAIAAANGLGMERALATITTTPAQILGLEDRIGSLEAGKDADLALFDGDPFEYTTRVCHVIIGGEVVSETCR